MIVDLFAGPGGWDVAAHELDLDPIGVEYEQWACATRAAAGFQTIRADVSTVDPARFAGLDGLIASPPCQGFSMAGKGAARDLIPELAASIRARRWDDRIDPDPRVWLIVDMGRWLEQLDPAWIALEQVPAVMPIWRCYADLLRGRGYSVWCGLLNAADFGVPQTRTRAILMAARGRVVHPPEPTHAREPVDSLFGTLEPWVTMAEALGWGMTSRPGMTLAVGTKSGGTDPMGVGGSGARRSLFGERDDGRWIEQGEIEVSDQFGDGEAHTPWYDPTTRPSRTVTGMAQRVRVGFPRRDDLGTSPDGYRERDWTPADEPAPTLTGRTMTGMVIEGLDADEEAQFEELGWGVLGDDWVVSTGMNTMSVSRDPQDMQPYERPIDEPAPTLGTMSGGQWSVGPPGHRKPPMRWKDDHVRDDPDDWKIETNDYHPDGVTRHSRPLDEPSPTLNGVGRSWRFVPADPVEVGEDWVVDTGVTNSVTSLDGAHQNESYERPITEPAPTLTRKSGGQWQIGPPGHRQTHVINEPTDVPDEGRLFDRADGRSGFKVEQRRGGDRIHEGVDPDEEPSPTVTTRADRWQVNTGRAWAEGGSREDAQVVDASNEPAPALTAKSGGQWQIRNTGRERATVRDGDEPAPTLAFGHTSSEWVFERPATTIQGDARAFSPGGHIANDGRDNSKMVGRSENAIRLSIEDALILQSFNPGFPVQGTKTRQFEQIGNAIPPLLAWHILRALIAGVDRAEHP